MYPSFDVIEPSLRDVDFGSLTITDVLEQIDKVRRSGRTVTPVRFHNDVAWMVVDYDAVASVIMNEEELPAADFFERIAGPWWGRVVPTMRGEEHRTYRASFVAPLLPTCVRTYAENVLRPIANELINKFADRRQIDIVAEYARPYPFRVITRLLDLPDADDPLMHKLVSELNQFTSNQDIASRARAAMSDYLRPFTLARRKNPGNDLISYFASTKVDGHLLDETDLIDCIRFIYPAAGENTTNAIGLLVYWILRDPATYDRVRENPECRQAAVEEALRIASPVSLIIRYTKKPVRIADTDIPAHTSILLAVGGANHDPAVFESPDQFLLTRGTNRHLSFGRGAHFCAGAHLARAELRVTLDVMLDRLPGLKLINPETIGFHGGIMRGPSTLPVSFAKFISEADANGKS